MKVCPVCQASFAEGFVYCPRDAERLVRFDLRAHLRERSREQGEFKFLLITDSFGARLRRALAEAVEDMRHDPRGFVLALWRGETSSQRHKLALQAGVALGVMAYSVIVTALLLLGLNASTTAQQLAEIQPPRPLLPDTTHLIVPLLLTAPSEFKRGNAGHLGGSSLQLKRAQGGGSGGDHQLTPASGGVRPHALLTAQIKLPDPFPPRIERPSLIVQPTVLADPATLPHVKGQIGLAENPPAPPSKGPGDGGGIGNQHGTGVGKLGDGAGLGPGNHFNTGGHDPSIGGHATTGPGDRNSLPRLANGRVRPTILFKEKARYSEEARQNKVQGTVVLMVTFNANGQITDVRVVRGQPFGLTEEAIQVAKQIRFQPAQENGVPVTVRAQLEYNFALY